MEQELFYLITRMESFGYGEGYLVRAVSFYGKNAFLTIASPPSLEEACNPKLLFFL